MGDRLTEMNFIRLFLNRLTVHPRSNLKFRFNDRNSNVRDYRKLGIALQFLSHIA